MTDEYSNDFTRSKKAEKRQTSHKLDGTQELNGIREELLQLQATAHLLLEMLAEAKWPNQTPGSREFAAFSERYRARSTALLDRLDRYIETRGG